MLSVEMFVFVYAAKLRYRRKAAFDDESQLSLDGNEQRQSLSGAALGHQHSVTVSVTTITTS